MTNANVEVLQRLLTLTNRFASVLWRFSTFLLFHPIASIVIISALAVQSKQRTPVQINFTMWFCVKSCHFFFNKPDLVMYFVVRAALDRKLFTCSTSSPTVFPAPSWFLPLNLTCSKIKHTQKNTVVIHFLDLLYCLYPNKIKWSECPHMIFSNDF